MDLSPISCKEINLGPDATLKISLKGEETRGQEAQSLVEKKPTKMGDNIKKSSAEHEKFIWVLALEAPSRSKKFARPLQHVNETKNEGMLEYTLIINDGQDIEETIVTYLQNSINSLENVNGCKLMGFILSAVGSVLNTENEGSYTITSLGGRYIISEDGQVQQCGPLTISCADASCVVVYGGEVVGPLVAVGDVQVVIATFAYDPSEDEV